VAIDLFYLRLQNGRAFARGLFVTREFRRNTDRTALTAL